MNSTTTWANEPAYPYTVDYGPDRGVEIASGVTKREAFAMAAMQGLMAAKYQGIDANEVPKALSEFSVKMADSLIAALNEVPDYQAFKNALALVRRGETCWCEMAVGNPMVTDHSNACKIARALMIRPEMLAQEKAGSGT